MRSDKYNNIKGKQDVQKPRVDDRWEETQMLFQNRNREREQMKRQQEYEARRREFEASRQGDYEARRREYEEIRRVEAEKRRKQIEAQREKDAVYQEYLAARQNPNGNRSPDVERYSRMRRQQREGRDIIAELEGLESSAAQAQTMERKENSRREERARERALEQEKIKRQKPVLETREDRDEKAERKAAKKHSKKSGKGKKLASSMGQDGDGKGGKVKRIILIIVMAVLILGILLFMMLYSAFGKVGDLDINESELGIDPKVAAELDGYQNIALLGVDARNMNDYDNCRTDAMIIVSLDKENKEIRQISIYRDTFVYVDGSDEYNKMTNVHPGHGTAVTIRTINQNLDLNIEDVVMVNWKAVADAVDGLGGVEIEILDSEIEEMNKYIIDTYNNIGGSNELITAPGLQTLNGNQAVTYARIRKDHAQGDYRRNERMKIMLSACIQKAKRTNPVKLNAIANEVLPQIVTNMNSNEMMGVMMKFIRSDMTGTTGYPYNVQGWTMPSGAWTAVPVTVQSNVVQLHEEFFAQPGYTPTETVQDISKNIAFKTKLYQ